MSLKYYSYSTVNKIPVEQELIPYYYSKNNIITESGHKQHANTNNAKAMLNSETPACPFFPSLRAGVAKKVAFCYCSKKIAIITAKTKGTEYFAGTT